MSGGIYSKFANRLCCKGMQWGGAYESAMHIQLRWADNGMDVSPDGFRVGVRVNGGQAVVSYRPKY